MNLLRNLKLRQLAQRIVSVCLSVVLAIGLVLSYSGAAQAATDTTSAATRTDANRINQRKENAPHYPNWYEDQRSLESYMDDADVNPKRRGDSPTDQNNDRGYNPIRQDRVNGYNPNSEENSNLIEQSRDQLRSAAENIRETLSPGSSTNSNYNNSNLSDNDIKDRAGNRLERAKEVFQGATERTSEGSNPTITGRSNR